MGVVANHQKRVVHEHQLVMMALRRLSMRAPTGVRQMSGHSIEEAIRA
jgi:hypothetical protein